MKILSYKPGHDGHVAYIDGKIKAAALAIVFRNDRTNAYRQAFPKTIWLFPVAAAVLRRMPREFAEVVIGPALSGQRNSIRINQDRKRAGLDII